MDQEWFKMKDIRRSNLAARAWIPLRAARVFERVGQYGFVEFSEDWFGAGSLEGCCQVQWERGRLGR